MSLHAFRWSIALLLLGGGISGAGTWQTVLRGGFGEDAAVDVAIEADGSVVLADDGSVRWSLGDCTAVLGCGTDGSWTIGRAGAVVRLESLAGPDRWRVPLEPEAAGVSASMC